MGALVSGLQRHGCRYTEADGYRRPSRSGGYRTNQHYGYVAGGKDASPTEESAYISAVFAKYYAGLGKVEVPLSEENFTRLGVSTTPTLVLVDKQGIVRLYNPGALGYEALVKKVEPLL